MKTEKSKDIRGSSPHSTQNSSRSKSSSEYNSSKEKDKKRKLQDEDSLLFMSSIEDKIIYGSLPKKKKVWHPVPGESPMTTEWVVSQKKVENSESDSSSEDESNASKKPSKADAADAADDHKESQPIAKDDSHKVGGKRSKTPKTDNFKEVMEVANMFDSDSETDLYEKKLKKKGLGNSYKKGYKDHSVKVTPLPSKNAMLVILNHPASITLYHYVSVSVLSGTVSIYGHEIFAGSTPVKVFSSELTGLVEVKTEKFENIWADKESYKCLDSDLTEITCDQILAHKILRRYKDNSVLIYVEHCIYPPTLEFLELYNPDLLQFKLKKRRGHYFLSNSDDSIKFGSEATKLANHIISAFRSTKLRDGDAPRILVYGRQNTGKSTLIRFLMNKVLNVFPHLYYFEGDPGQTEFTPPGCVSLTRVTKPVIDPPFCHPRKTDTMVFTGSVTAATSIEMYINSIYQVFHVYKNYLSEEILFVNTMGWIEGLGLQCLMDILKIVRPTILIEIAKEDDTSMFDYRECIGGKIDFYQIQPQFPEKKLTNAVNLSAREMRHLSLLAYFGKCQLRYDQPRYLHEFEPFEVNWDRVPVYAFGSKVAPHKLVEAINFSIVALCSVPKKLVLESKIEKFQTTLEDDPVNECIGYGFVRGVNTRKHLLYIVTPVKKEELVNVNAIMKGKVLTPPAVVLNQPYIESELKCTYERIIYADEDEAFQKVIPKRHRRSVTKQK